jgi:hypothetical protein
MSSGSRDSLELLSSIDRFVQDEIAGLSAFLGSYISFIVSYLITLILNPERGNLVLTFGILTVYFFDLGNLRLL